MSSFISQEDPRYPNSGSYDQMTPPDHQFHEEEVDLKLVFIGDSGVGKTSLVNRFIKGEMDPDEVSTVGVMFQTQYFEHQNKHWKLQIWDTAGQERFKSITPLYYKDAQGVFIVCDVTMESSFESLKQWYQDVKEQGSVNCKICFLLNKIDTDQNLHEVDERIFEEFAKLKGSMFFATSAVEGTNLEKAFQEMVQQIDEGEFDDDHDLFHRKTTKLSAKEVQKLKDNQEQQKGCKC